MRLYYSKTKEGEDFVLTEDDYRHSTKVLRQKVGDPISIIDGSGNLFHCNIKAITKKEVYATILNYEVFPPPSYNLTIAIAPLKNSNRIEFFFEKSVEIGISRIQPMITKNTEKINFKPQRAERIMLSAMKQSKNIYQPILATAQPFSDVVKNCQTEGKFIAFVPEDSKKLHQCQIPQKTTILIGPEGGFTREEIKFAIEAGFIPVSIGNSRLRTETAGIVACQIVAQHFF